MILRRVYILLTALAFSHYSHAEVNVPQDYLNEVSPALEKYSQDILQQDVWKRPELNLRDRSLITLAAMIARDQHTELKKYMELALNNGVKPSEISEMITQLAFYAGRENALNAAKVAWGIFHERHVNMKEMPAAEPVLAPVDERSEAHRLDAVQHLFGNTGRPLARYTTDVLFRNLWLRPGLTPRDRSLVTVSALIANGKSAEMPLHLPRAMDNGLSQAQTEEMIAQLAFYIGWPNAFSAQSVATAVFNSRSH